MTNNTLQQISSQLTGANTVAIFCHQRPDGDALGSGLALCLALRNAGKKAWLILEEQPPQKFFFLPEMKQVICNMPQTPCDLMVSVDCGDLSRLGNYMPDYVAFKGVTLNIDHHISNNFYGKLNYVVDCPATCEIMVEILQSASFEVTPAIANLLMMGLVTDSGNFVHQDVSSKTFQVASFLRDHGADVTKISYEMFTRQPKARALLYGRVMAKMRFALDGQLNFITTTIADMQACGAERDMTEGFVDFPLSVDGVEVSCALLEFRQGQYKVSLRSKGRVNVNIVASQFGGGGHVLASGCMIFGEYEEVIERLTYAIYQQL